MCVLIFSITFVWNIFHSKNNSARYHIWQCLHIKCPLFISDFKWNWIFSTNFKNILKYQITWKSVKWEPNCPMMTDGWTGRHDEANSGFSQFSECTSNDRKGNTVTVWMAWLSIGTAQGRYRVKRLLSSIFHNRRGISYIFIEFWR